MKTTLRLLASLLLLYTGESIFSQTLVNQQWANTSGTAGYKYNFVNATTDADNNTYVLSNTRNNLLQDMFTITAYDPYGNLLWENTYNNTADSAAYGIDLFIDDVTGIYAIGVIYDSASASSDWITLRLDYNGNILWYSTYRGAHGGYNIPTNVCIDPDTGSNTPRVYVGGTEQISDTGFEFTIIKYDTSGNQIWVTHYDSSGLYNIVSKLNTTVFVPVGIDVSPIDGIMAYGCGGTSPSNWHIEWVDINRTTGDIEFEQNYTNEGAVLTSMVGINEDINGNLYVVGTLDSAGANPQIELMQFDPYFGVEWEYEFSDPGSVATNATGFALDPITGYLAISGTSTNSTGGQNAVVVACQGFDNTFLWNQSVPASNPILLATANDVALDNNDNAYVTGATTIGTQLKYLTQSYDQYGDLLWQKTYSRCSTCNDIASTILLDDNSNPVVSGISMSLTDTTYATVAYEQWSPAACAESVTPPKGYAVSDCPTISYNFENGQITITGTDTFVEFDIYASQSDSTAPFSGSTIYFTYSTNVFGGSVVDSNNIAVTYGTVTADTTYKFALTDTLLPSNAVPTNGSEVALTITSTDSTRLYDVADTFQWLCHIKMKMKKKATLQIWYDQFFMQNLSLYNSYGSNEYNYVQTGALMAIAANASSVTLTYTLADAVLHLNSTPPTFDVNVRAWANAPVDIFDAETSLNWDQTVIIPVGNPPTIDLTNNFGSWAPPIAMSNIIYDNNTYEGAEYFDQDDLSVFCTADTPVQNTLHDWTTDNTNKGEIFYGLHFIIKDCQNNPQLQFPTPYTLILNDYYDASGIITQFHVDTAGNITAPLCPTSGITETTINKTSLKAMPNPFTNSLCIGFIISETGPVSLYIEDLIGQNIYTANYGSLSIGYHDKIINLPSNLVAGVYMLKLTANNQESIVKVVKQ